MCAYNTVVVLRTKCLGPAIILLAFSLFCFNTFIPYYRVIDDAYISFRYSKNLTDGHGLVWNPGGKPVEGYSNFLLVLAEVPFLAMDIDPLHVAQALSFFSTLGIALLLFLWRRREENATWTDPRPGLIACLFLCIPIYNVHIMMGLETMIASFFLVLTFFCLARFIEKDTSANNGLKSSAKSPTFWLISACLSGFAAGLSRPEGFPICFLMIALSVVIKTTESEHRIFLKQLLHWVISVFLAFGLPTLLYQVWRLNYFGDLFPNSYYIKVITDRGKSLPGIPHLKGFLSELSVLIILAAAVFRRRWRRQDILLLPPLAFALLFYLRSNHIMAFSHRFYVPFIPFIVLLGAPAISETLYSSTKKTRLFNLIGFAVFFYFAFIYHSPLYKDVVKKEWSKPSKQEETHFMLGRLMATLPGIRNLLVVGPDAGAMPYFSGARWIDPIGLNDNFIARHSRIPTKFLIDYLFNRNPDIWILCKRGKKFVKRFPGPLGNATGRIFADRRFKKYKHLASYNKNSGGRYQYHFFGSKDLKHWKTIKKILSSKANFRWR